MEVGVTAATHFTDMAALIAHNDESRFAGAVVVVPPGGDEPISVLELNQNKDPAQFWAKVMAAVEQRKIEALQAATDAQRGQGGWR